MTNQIVRVAAIALATLCCISAYAADTGDDSTSTTTFSSNDHPRSYIACLPGYFYADKGHDATRTGFTLSGIYGYQFSKHWAGEVNVFGTTINTGPHVDSDFYQEGLTLDIAYNFVGDRDHFTPFVIAGVGGVYDDVTPNRYDAVNVTANAGLGFVTGPVLTSGVLNGLRIRAEGRYVYDREKSATRHGLSDARASIGVEIPLGEKAAPPPPPPPPPIIKIVHVPAPVVGDSDGDGVDDSKDKCPNTLPGTRVDSHGCAIGNQTVQIHGVHFQFNKSRLQPDAKTILNEAAEAMKGQPSMTVQIAGHTDSIGSDAYNLKLSDQRANSVREYLISQGIDSNRLTAKGYGESQPLISPEKTDADRELNRRVEFRIEKP